MKLLGAKLLALLRSTHPIPSFAVTLFTVLFAVGVGLSLNVALLLGLTVLLQQFSVGLSNDWIDFRRDKLSARLDKPSVQGLVSKKLLRNTAFVMAVAAQTTAFFLGPTAALLMAAMLAAGWAYNLGMKANWSSFVPYAIGFGLLPVFVGAAAPTAANVPVWVVLVAALFGVSAHFANALPDVEEDKANGIGALPHILGQRSSAVVISVLAVTGSAITATQSASLAPWLATLGLVVTAALAGMASFLSLRQRPPKAVFTLVLAASFVNAVLLMFGVGQLL